MSVITIAAGATSRPHVVPAGSLFKVSPAVGASAIVEYTTASAASIANGVAQWAVWPKGTVSSEVADLANNTVSVRITAVGGAVSFDINSAPSTSDVTPFRPHWGKSNGIQLATDPYGAPLGVLSPDGFPVDGAVFGANNGDRLLPGIPLLAQPLLAELGTAGSPNTTQNGINITGVMGTGANGYPAPKIVTREGVQCIEMVFASVGTITIAKKVPVGMPVDATYGPYGGMVEMAYEIESAYGMRGTQPNLLFTDATLNVGMQALISVGSANGWTGTHVHAPMPINGATNAGLSDWQPRNGGSWATAFTHVVAKFSCVAEGVGTRVWLYNIIGGQKRTLPKVYIIADDGHYTWFDLGLPTLEKYGLRCDMAYIHDYALLGRANNSASIAEWQAAVARGHNAIVHGPRAFTADGVTGNSMRNYYTASKRKPGQSVQDAVYEDICWNRDGMIANGLDPYGRGRHVYALPQGEHQDLNGYGDKSIENALVAAGMKVCRLASAGLGSTGFCPGPAYSRQPLYLPIIGHSGKYTTLNTTPDTAGESQNITNLKNIINYETSHGRSVPIMLHQVYATETTAPLVIQQSNLENLCAYIAQLRNAGQLEVDSLQSLVPRVMLDAQRPIA